MPSRRQPYKKRQRVNGGVISDGRELPSRACLGHCGKEFQPLFKGNRICAECAEINKTFNGSEYKVGRTV